MGARTSSAIPAWLHRTWRRIWFRWRRDRLDRELAEEIEYHRLLIEEAGRREGFATGAAATLSRRQMGNLTATAEECRDMWSFVRIERLLHDVRYAIRMFRRAPVFTAVAILSLTLGIGGNAAMFSLVNALLVRPLPYPQADHLFRITGVFPRAALPFFQSRSQTMEIAAAGAPEQVNLTGAGEAMRVSASTATANLFAVLGIAPAIGRGFGTGDDAPGRDRLVILSHSLWQARFGGDPSVIGRSISLNGTAREIIAVMPAGFGYPSPKTQLWVPMRLDPSNFLEFWGGAFLPLIGRLQPGHGIQEARADVRGLAERFLRTFPYPMPRDFNRDSTPIPLQQDLVGDVRKKLMILLASVGVVLLIACTNVAALLLSRAGSRRKEIALRTALGAGRARVIRQLLTESSLLALAGGGLGIALGMGVLSVFKSVLPASTPGLGTAAIDGPVAAAVAALALLTGVAFGLAPALSASQIDLAGVIRTGSPRAAGARWTRLRSGLVGTEIALTVVLAVSAGLLIRSLYTLSEVRPGFEPAGILTVRISPNQAFCGNRGACIALYSRLLARAGEIAGVAETAMVNSLPLDGAQPTLAVDVEDHPKSPDHPAPLLWAGAISAGYLHAMRIPLLGGRDLTEADGAAAARVVLISAAAAKHFWPGANPIGKHIKTTGETRWRTIVGVVGDVQQFELGRSFPDFIPGAFYMPYAQAAREDGQIPAAMTLLVRTRGDLERIARELHAAVSGQDPNIPVGQPVPLAGVVAGSISDFRATIRVFISFAASALLLAAIGIYGLVSYWAGQRTFEIGVRMAIGASRGRIVSMIFGQGLRIALFGTAAGLVAALAATRFVAGLLFGVGATDAATFAAVAAVVLGVAAAATLVPAWKASRIEPTRSLRAE